MTEPIINLITVIGARPQFIKAATISRAINLFNIDKKIISEKILHTGQHYDKNMSQDFFGELTIPEPFVNLNIGGGTHGSNTGRMIESIEEILLDEKPDGIIVYGDTNSTLAGAIAASKLNIGIFHIEAGLRSYNRIQPEEKNRILTDHISDLCFAPTSLAVKNLENEGISKKRIIFSGDVMFDATKIFDGKIKKSLILERLKLKNRNFALATIHREENTDNIEKLINIFTAFEKIKIPVVLVLHPRTKAKLKNNNLYKLLKPLIILNPLGYCDMNFLVKKAMVVITDSGGLQKEAFFQATPCVTVRSETEWVELTQSGWNKLADPSSQLEIIQSIEKQMFFDVDQQRPNFYGEGNTAEKIIPYIYNFCFGK